MTAHSTLLIILCFPCSMISQAQTEIQSDVEAMPDLIIEDQESAPVKDYDGNAYRTVRIGDQVWIAENLRATHFSDGREISFINDQTEWYENKGSAWSHQDKRIALDTIYGRLYNWYAAKENPCPIGWHVATDEDWMQLEQHFGMSAAETQRTNFRGSTSNVAGKLGAIKQWGQPNTGTITEQGFSALPNGIRFDWGNLPGWSGASASWWTSSEITSDMGYYRLLNNSSADIFRGYAPKGWGHCLRCVKDIGH